MFIDIDYSKKPKNIKLHLAKPNKQIISHIKERFKPSLSLKLGNINELSFSIPYKIEDENFQLIDNPHIELIKQKMLIRATMDTQKEWFIVDEINKDSDDSDVFSVKAFSLGYENKHKRISEMEEESVNANEVMTQLLTESNWTVGTIDPIFNAMYRQFKVDDSNVLDSIIQVGETYGALIKWDTALRQVSLLNLDTYGKFRGMTVSEERLLRSISESTTSDELVTRLFVYGNEDISINSVNPTGQSYIEDFSYFMYPFERDVDRNVVNSSHFMSDALCHAILDHQALVQQNAPQINSLVDQKATKQAQLVTEQSTLNQLNLELENILNLLDIAKATEDEALITQRTTERNDKQTEITAQTVVVSGLNSDIADLDTQIGTLQDEISNDPNFTPELRDELNYYVIEQEWRDDRYINPQELYDDGLKKFTELREPKVTIKTTIDNLMNVIEEQYYWDKLVLGDLIKVKKKQMKIEHMAKIIEINYDFESEELDLVIANTKDLLNETEKFVQLLYNASSTSSLVENSKHIWDKITPVSNQVSNILSSEWEANKNKIIAGINNQTEIGNRGIIIRNPDLPNEIVVMQAGVIALSKNSGETWQTAINANGIVAERLLGRILAGENLIITNSAGTFTFDNTGAKIKASSFIIESGTGSNLIDDWNTDIDNLQGRMTTAEFKLQDDQIVSVVSSSESFLTSLDSKLENYDFHNDLLYWKENHNLSTPLNTTDATIISGQGNYGNKVVQVSGQKYVFYGKQIPIDTSRTYRVKFRVRQTTDPITSGEARVFAGVASFDVNNQPLTTVYFGEHRYCAVANQNITVADGWQEFNGIITGEGIDSYNQFIQGTKYAVPMFVINFSNGDGIAEVDICSLEDITLEDNVDGLATRISSAEEKITDDAIVNTVTQSISYQSNLESKADVEDLANYATSDDLDQAINDVSASTDNKIAGIDFSPYATKSEVTQTATDMTIKFSSSGGINLLTNSVGFAGTDFWTITGTANSIQNDELTSKGSGSGFVLNDGLLSQNIIVTGDQTYTIATQVKKGTTGSGYLRVSDGSQIITRSFNAGTAYNYEKSEIKITPLGSQITVQLYGDATSGIVFTNTMANIGTVALQWQHSSGEIYNSNIRMNSNGIRVSQISNGKEIGFTKMTPDKFAGYFDVNGDGVIDETVGSADEVFRMDQDEFVMKKATVKQEITMGSIKIVKVNSVDKNGWAFVSTG